MKKSARAKNTNVKAKYVRPSWDEYFMSIAELTGARGTCNRGRSGCFITKDKRILVTGYVGSPAGAPHCDDVGHEMSKVIGDDGIASDHCVRTIHAELNAIAQAAQIGTAIGGGTLYCHMTPCYTCAKVIINAGIKRVVVSLDYHRPEKSKKIFKEAGVKLDILDPRVEDYKHDRFMK